MTDQEVIALDRGENSPAEAVALDAVPEQYRVNLDGLAKVVGITTNTIRGHMKQYGSRFPVVIPGSHGRDYVFDARAVVAFYAELAEEEEARRRAEEEKLKGLRLELMGGESVDEKSAVLSPKDRREILHAEVLAGQLQRQRGELVRASEVEDAARVWNARIRDEMLATAAKIARELALERDDAIKVEEAVKVGLRRAARSAAKAFQDSGVTADVA